MAECVVRLALPVVQLLEAGALALSVQLEDVEDTHGVVRVGAGVSGLEIFLNHLHTRRTRVRDFCLARAQAV